VRRANLRVRDPIESFYQSTFFYRLFFAMRSMLLLLMLLISFDASVRAQPSEISHGPMLDARDFGAVPGDDRLDTSALQAALDAAHARGGGTVVLSAGTFDSGTLRLRSHVRLHIGPGATLRGSADLADYDPDHPHLLYGADVENVALTGTGRLNGQGPVFWRETDGEDDLVADRDERPWRFVRFERSRDVLVRDLTFEDSPSHTLYFFRSRGVLIDGVTIRNPARGPNTDGIDLQGTSDVRISNCHIATGDDAICLKGNAGVTENVTVTNCYLESDDAAIKFGTGSRHAIRHVTVDNIVIRRARYGIAFFMKYGGVFEHARFSDIVMTTGSRHRTEYPVYLDVDRRSPDLPYGTIRNVTFSGLDITTRGNLLLAGHPAAPLRNLTLDDVRVTVRGGVDLTDRRKPTGNRTHHGDDESVDLASIAAHLTLGHAAGVVLRDVAISTDRDTTQADRHALYVANVTDLTLDGLRAQHARLQSARAAVRLHNPGAVLFLHPVALPGTSTFLRVTGTPTGRIRMVAPALFAAEVPWRLDDGVPKATLVETSRR
jgi:hypothetical protein